MGQSNRTIRRFDDYNFVDCPLNFDDTEGIDDDYDEIRPTRRKRSNAASDDHERVAGEDEYDSEFDSRYWSVIEHYPKRRSNRLDR